MVCFPNNKFILVSTSELALPVYVKDILEAAGMEYKEVTDLEEVIGELDVLYMTRIQKERFASEEEYQSQSGNYILDTRKLSMGKPDLIVLHPLPRVDEIAIEVDDDPRAMYFKQAKYGMYIRMALILTVINGDEVFMKPLMKAECISTLIVQILTVSLTMKSICHIGSKATAQRLFANIVTREHWWNKIRA